MDWETALISKILDERDIRSVVKQKVGSDFFFGTVSKAAFQWLQEWYRNPQYGDTPSWDMFLDTFDGFEGVETSDSITSLCEKVREKKLYYDIAETIQEVSDVTSGDAFEGWEAMKKQVSRLSIKHTINKATRVQDHIGGIKAEYIRMRDAGPDEKLRGLPYPWRALSDATLGACGGNLIIYYGRPKSKKTWLGLETVKVWADHGANVGCFSQELSDVEMARRYVALVTGVDYRAFCRGELDQATERDFFLNLEMFAERPPFDIDMLEKTGADVELELKAKCEEMGWTAIMIDGGHHCGADWKELGAFTKACKRVAKHQNIPCLITTHANRRGGKPEVGGNADDMAHSDAFFQDCDLALRIVCDIEQKRDKEVVAWISAIREGDTAAFAINTHLAQDLSQKRVITIGEADDEADDGKGDGVSVEIKRDFKTARAHSANRKKNSKMNGASKRPRLVL